MDNLDLEIEKAQQQLAQMQNELQAIGGRLGWLDDELQGLEWLRANGNAQAAERFDRLSDELGSLKKAKADREAAAAAITEKIGLLQQEREGLILDQAGKEAQAAELAYYVAYLAFISTAEALKQAERRRGDTRRAAESLIAHVRDLGGHVQDLSQFLDGDEATRKALQFRIEELSARQAALLLG